MVTVLLEYIYLLVEIFLVLLIPSPRPSQVFPIVLALCLMLLATYLMFKIILAHSANP